MKKSLLWRLLRRTDMTGECWEWTGAKFSGGYGAIRVKGHSVPTHRVAYEEMVGRIPDGMLVCHSCDNPGCINPAHLFIGTQKDNVADKYAKHREVNLCGEDHGNAKLTRSNVMAIRKRISTESASSLSREFGVSVTHIIRVANGTSWKHIEEVA